MTDRIAQVALGLPVPIRGRLRHPALPLPTLFWAEATHDIIVSILL